MPELDFETLQFKDDGLVPNNPALPVVLMRAAIQADQTLVADTYSANGWCGRWVWTVFDYHHYHPDAHEVLTCLSGHGDILIGGPSGRTIGLSPGDVCVLPAGVGHKNEGASRDFAVIGAYPPGQEQPEIRKANRENYPGMSERIAAVALPRTCPIFGANGPTMTAWAA
ncbi:MAG: cupin domain-containing protein [Pseudomonadota bacterium]